MSKSVIRKDKTCLNCRHVVENRFCPNCGQENTETRKTFHHLFIHFFEDLTHYENAFWKTIGNLITKPGTLTREYLSGRRMSYLAPVRLYIFISFITFFIIAMLPANKLAEPVFAGKPKNGVHFTNRKTLDSIAAIRDSLNSHDGEKLNTGSVYFTSQKKLDSIQRFGKPEEKLGTCGYWFASKAVHVIEHNTREQMWEKFKESFAHNISKVLFIYMPFFAFVLWLFNDKKRWFYFDHGIFTLHYFSFLLLGILVYNLYSALIDMLPDNTIINVVDAVIGMAMSVYIFYYFFPAHHRFYGGKRRVTVLKGICMLFINSILAGIIMLAFTVYTFINIK